MPTGALRVLESLTPGSGHPMDWLAIGIMALGAADSTGDSRSGSMNLIARMPELMARLFLLRGGKSEELRPRKPELGIAVLFFEDHENDRAVWTQYAHALLAGNEFQFIE